jgi:hypothetical protein
MATVFEFIAELLVSGIELTRIFIFDILFRTPFDPLAAISFLVGGAITLFSIAFFGYLVLGAVASLFSDSFGSLGRAPPQRD